MNLWPEMGFSMPSVNLIKSSNQHLIHRLVTSRFTVSADQSFLTPGTTGNARRYFWLLQLQERRCYWIQLVEDRAAAKHPTVHRRTLQQGITGSPNVSSVEVEEPWCPWQRSLEEVLKWQEGQRFKREVENPAKGSTTQLGEDTILYHHLWKMPSHGQQVPVEGLMRAT